VNWVVLVLLCAGGAFCGHSASGELGAQLAVGAPNAPVLVELFTSEGCPFCPPADELLGRLSQTQPVPGVQIIALKEHVDYWNRDDWRDPFSSPQFTKRQHGYATAFEKDQVYTPQMVVDGRAAFNGIGVTHAKQMIAQAAHLPKVPVRLEWVSAAADGPVVLRVRVDPLLPADASETTEVLLAVTEDHLRSEARAGRNEKKAPEHFAVVRTLQSLGNMKPQAGVPFSAQTEIALDKSWKRSDLRVVVFLQQIRSRHVLGSAVTPLPAL